VGKIVFDFNDEGEAELDRMMRELHADEPAQIVRAALGVLRALMDCRFTGGDFLLKVRVGDEFQFQRLTVPALEAAIRVRKLREEMN
jgi:hypothetical protein